MIRARLISYEIVWATPRIDPKEAYFLLDAHPIIKRGEIPKLRTTKNLIIIIGHEGLLLFRGNKAQRNKEIINIVTGLRKKSFQLIL